MESLIDAKLDGLNAALKRLAQNRPLLRRKSSMIVHIYSGFLLASDDFLANAASCPNLVQTLFLDAWENPLRGG